MSFPAEQNVRTSCWVFAFSHPVSLQASSLAPCCFLSPLTSCLLTSFPSKMKGFHLRGNCHTTAGDSVFPHSARSPVQMQGLLFTSCHSLPELLNVASLTRNRCLFITKESTIISSLCLPAMLTAFSCRSFHIQWGLSCWGACSRNPLKCLTCVYFIQPLKSGEVHGNCALWC